MTIYPHSAIPQRLAAMERDLGKVFEKHMPEFVRLCEILDPATPDETVLSQIAALHAKVFVGQCEERAKLGSFLSDVHMLAAGRLAMAVMRTSQQLLNPIGEPQQ